MDKTPRGEVVAVLSPEDQKAYGIRYSTMSFSDPRSRRFCEQMAVLVCLREGFGSAGNVTVRAVENSSGELLLYFSLSREESSRLRSRVVEFSDSDALLDCRNLFPRDGTLQAEVYFQNGKYYLWYQLRTSARLFDRLSSALSEFCSPSDVDRTYLAEHALPLPAAQKWLTSRP